MRLEDIIETALIDKWFDKYTNEYHEVKPYYKILDSTIHIYTPIKPYKIVVLKRLLKAYKKEYNIIIGDPDL